MASRRTRRKTDPANASPEPRTFREQKRLGRPPLPPGEALDALFAVRCRTAEKTRFEALAAAAGVSLTAWARRMLLAVADRGEGASPSNGPGGKRRLT